MNRYERNNVVIVIVCALFLLGISAIIYFFFFYDKKNNNENDSKEKLFIDIKDEDVIKGFEKLIDDKKLYNIDKLDKNIDDFNTLSSKIKLNIGFYSVYENETDPHTNGIELKKIESYFKNTFKSTIYFDANDIYYDDDNELLYSYNKLTSKYEYNEKHKSHEYANTISNIYNKVIEVKKRNNTYVITNIKLWGNKIDDSYIIYGSYKDAINNTNELFKVKSSENIKEYSKNELENNLELYKEKMTKYTYTFEKENDKYLLVSYKYKR